MEKESKIYIAGHRGSVGSALKRKLESKGYTNLIFRTHRELDLTNRQVVNEFFEQEKPEYVILAAAKVGGILANSTYLAEFIYENLMIEANIIHASYKYGDGVKKLLFLGSSSICPKLAPQPLKEEYLLTGPLKETNEAYTIAKITGIRLFKHYNQQYGTNFFYVMPTNLYGPNDNFYLETSHVMPALIRKFHEVKVNNEPEAVVCIIMRKIDRVKKRFVEEGLEVALNGEKRDHIYTKKVDGDLEAHLVAISCSEPS